MAVYNLRRFQLGKQTSWGTPVTATAQLRGVTDGEISVDTAVEMFSELGYNVPGVAMGGKKTSSGSYKATASYEQILYPLHGLFGAVSPSGTGPYTWEYSIPQQSAVTPQIYTLEYGMAGAEYKLGDVLVSKISLSAEAGKLLEASVDFVSPSTPSPETMVSLASQDVKLISAAGGAVYFDSLNGTPGSTAMPATLISFSIDIDPKRHFKLFLDDITSYGDDVWDVSGSISLEYNATGKAFVEEAISGIKQGLCAVRFSSGTSQLELQFGYTVTGDVTLFSDRDGNATAELSFSGTYSTSLGSALKIIVKNDWNTLP